MALANAKEKSTYVVDVTFYDETGTTVVPDSAHWYLRDNNGAIVNNRNGITVQSLLTTISILLSGNDLIYEKNSSNMRVLVVEAFYSSSLGSTLPLNEEVTFEIDDLQL
jgi:hypothetical protein